MLRTLSTMCLICSAAIAGLFLGASTIRAFNAPGPKWTAGAEFTEVCYFLTSSAKSRDFSSPSTYADNSWNGASLQRFKFKQTSKNGCPMTTTQDPGGPKIKRGASYWDGEGEAQFTSGDTLMNTICTKVGKGGSAGYNNIVRCKVKTNNSGIRWVRGSTSQSCWDGNDNRIDIETIMLHEKGHWLELQHTSSGPVMNGYPYVAFNPCTSSGKMVIRKSLTSDDTAGIRSIYP